uniref:UDP-glucoronosyl and UDP-glucosyl transferase family protein n=1 Tax=Bionectria ochroleuca TaxID=29856 RepID=A0A8H7K1P1_BIOOC
MSPSTVIQAASGIIMAPPKVLMLVNSELGQANVFIATAHALLQEDPGVDIHFASFPALQETLRDALGGAGDHGSTPFTFHPLPGRAMFKCFQEEEDLNNNIHTVSLQKPGVRNSPNSQKFIMTKAFLCWTAEEFASIYKSVDATIDHVKPDIVLVDTIFTPAITAARDIRANGSKDYKLAILSPNSLKDFVHHLEPGLAAFWKWPVVASANMMPIPWYWVPFNIYLVLRMIWLVLTNKNVANMGKKVAKLVGSPNLEIAENISLCHNNMKGIDKIFIGSRAEVDFPELDLVNLPQDYWARIVPCGPIVRPIQPIEPELSAWLQRRPTVLVNLGSHCVVNETEAVDMARSLRRMMDHSRKSGKELQVLWKMKKDSIRSPDLETGPGSVLYARFSALRLRRIPCALFSGYHQSQTPYWGRGQFCASLTTVVRIHSTRPYALEYRRSSSLAGLTPMTSPTEPNSSELGGGEAQRVVLAGRNQNSRRFWWM